MTKEFLRSELRNLLASIDKVGKYHNTFLDHVLETCINSVYYQVHAQNPKALGQYTWRYAMTLTLGQYEGYVAPLPVELVPLPDKRGGARVEYAERVVDPITQPTAIYPIAILGTTTRTEAFGEYFVKYILPY